VYLTASEGEATSVSPGPARREGDTCLLAPRIGKGSKAGCRRPRPERAAEDRGRDRERRGRRAPWTDREPVGRRAALRAFRPRGDPSPPLAFLVASGSAGMAAAAGPGGTKSRRGIRRGRRPGARPAAARSAALEEVEKVLTRAHHPQLGTGGRLTTMKTNVLQVVTAASGLAATAAAAFAARMSRAAVERDNLAFVWAEVTDDRPDSVVPRRRIRVQLHSDGPGIALDVRWSLDGPSEDGRRAHRRAQEAVAARATPAIRALRPGASYPALAIGDTKDAAAIEDLYGSSEQYIQDDGDAWWILVRWTDSAGQRWEFSESSAGRVLARPPRKVRRHARSWRPWWALLLPPWWAWTQPGRIDRRQRREW
jgi:hypothetical protein